MLKPLNNNPGLIAAILSIYLLVPAVLYSSTLSMIHVWYVNETFTHGFLIFPISLWLIWEKRSSLFAQPVRQEWAALVFLIPVLGLWYVARIVDVQVAQHLALILCIPVVVLIVLGRHVFMSIAFPLIYLIFAIPAGQGLIPVMMEFTANFAVSLVEMVGIPVYQDGLYFTLPSGNWSVVEECSGVRYLIASMALGTMYAYLTYTSLLKRLIFIAFAIIVPILANGLRAFGIVMLGHYSGMKLATGVDHLVYGWVFFGFVIFLMFYIGSYWRDEPIDDKQDSEPSSPEKRYRFNEILNPAFMVTLGLLVCVSLITDYRTSQELKLPPQSQLTLTDQTSNWIRQDSQNLGWIPLMSEPDLSLNKLYRSNNGAVQLDIGFYFYQKQGAEAVSTTNRLVAALRDEWAKISASRYALDDVIVEETILRQGERRLLIWKWYRIGNWMTSNIYAAKVADAYNQVMLNRNDAAMLTLATALEDSTDKSRKRLQDFYKSFSQEIYSGLEKQAETFHQLN